VTQASWDWGISILVLKQKSLALKYRFLDFASFALKEEQIVDEW